jgi:hypothetical protein
MSLVYSELVEGNQVEPALEAIAETQNKKPAISDGFNY